uniref:Uncharacterized protein n=1 Tax=Oryza meridionalis TaxID=40149 RepID=A0A0E0EIB7_9ORYZ
MPIIKLTITVIGGSAPPIALPVSASYFANRFFVDDERMEGGGECWALTMEQCLEGAGAEESVAAMAVVRGWQQCRWCGG